MNAITDPVNPALSLAALAHQFERLSARAAVQNLMGRYSFFHSAGMHAECADFFALKTPGVRAEMMWGIYEGEAGIRRLYPAQHAWADGDGVGIMHVHTLTTAVVEVAGDGKTAKAAWVSPGHETINMGKDLPVAHWAWCKYGADFIKEQGEWKIWHLHVYGMFLSRYDSSWVERPDDHAPQELPPELRPDRPPTTHWMYTADRRTECVPMPPRPYHSFSEDDAY